MVTTTGLQCILGVLTLFGLVRGGEPPSRAACKSQAWVRAPDLTPNAIVQGDVRFKISAECPDVDDMLLGLRFKERSFVKALRSRDDLKRLSPERRKIDSSKIWSPWRGVPSRFANRSVRDAYEETLMNKDLWIVREEERIVFETTQPIDIGQGARDVIQDFSILVPSTNFPPTYDPFYAWIHQENEIVNAERIYEYFAKVSFANGTVKDISTGFTAFQPLHSPGYAPDGPRSAAVELTKFNGDNTPVTNYSIEINSDSGMTFFTGEKNHIVTAIVSRTGPARAFSAPLSVSVCVETSDFSPKWGAEYGVSDAHTRFSARSPSALSTSNVGKQPFAWQSLHSCQSKHKISVDMPDSTWNEIQANETVTTRSIPFTVNIDVNEELITTFETYYQTLANMLTITLETPCTNGELIDPDEPFREPDFSWNPSFEDDEEEWVPWEKKSGMQCRTLWNTYSGHVPVVVNPGKETPLQVCPRVDVDTSGQMILSQETICKQPALIHYLTEGARGPIFVDRNAIPELLAEDLATRQLRAPILKPVTISPPEGEEATHRYYRTGTNDGKPPIYVGETWIKKVVHKNEDST